MCDRRGSLVGDLVGDLVEDQRGSLAYSYLCSRLSVNSRAQRAKPSAEAIVKMRRFFETQEAYRYSRGARKQR